MNINYRKIISITLSILFLSSSSLIPSLAFSSCKKRSCLKNQQRMALPIGTIGGGLDSSNDGSNDGSNNNNGNSEDDGTTTSDGNDGSNTGDGNNDSNNDGGTTKSDDGDISTGGDDSTTGDGGSGPGVGSGGTGGDLDQCMENFAKLGVEKAFLACKINTAIERGKRVIGVYQSLQRRMSRLLRIMRRAPVCTNNGYDIKKEYKQNHAIGRNIKKLRDIVKSIKELLEKLDEIYLDCTNCADEAALNAALAKIQALEAELNALITKFKNEMSTINNRFNNFINRLRRVIAAHSTNPFDIMRECNVNYRTAVKMSKRRLRVIDEINKLIDYKKKVDKRIAEIDFGNHDCKKPDIDKFKLAIACALF